MPTNDERREVARKLREIVPDRFNSILYGIHLSNVGIGPCAQIVSAHSCIIRDVALRLADLIEPEPERMCHNVDREALAKLADSIEKFHTDYLGEAMEVHEYWAGEIRKAIGDGDK